MPPTVRVVGRIDVAEPICAALRAAGFDAHVTTAAPSSALLGTPPPGGVDVVVGTSFSDPPLWRMAKRTHPLRPMVAVMQRGRERVLRGTMARKFGPDACVTWPAPMEELSSAIERAQASAGRPRTWGRGDLASALVFLGLSIVYLSGGLSALGGGQAAEALAKGVGMLVAAVGLLVGLPFARRQWLHAAGAALLGSAATAAVAIAVVAWAR